MSTDTTLALNTLGDFNAATTDDALKLVTHWCAAPLWAEAIVAHRPFQSIEALAETTKRLWAEAPLDDWLAAFAAHPVIGDVALLRSKYAPQANVEQGQVLQASEATIAALGAQNLAYRKRHGFTFIVFATGKSASQMLELLNARINNPTDTEHKNAAAEQLKIMQLRLQQSFADEQQDTMSHSTLSTHILNLDEGAPAEGVSVELRRTNASGIAGEVLADNQTDADGRASDWPELTAGTYELTFAIGDWFSARGQPSFYPRVRIEFIVDDARHYHVPLLLNKYGFSSYRGS